MSETLQNIIVYAAIVAAVAWCVVRIVRGIRHKHSCCDCPLYGTSESCSCHHKKHPTPPRNH